MNELTITKKGKIATIKAGDKVSFTRTQQRGSSINVSSRDGVLMELGEEFSSVRAAKARAEETVRTDSLRPAGWQNALTEGLLAAFTE